MADCSGGVDGAEDTLKPRLVSAGADCARIAFIDDSERGLTLNDVRIEDAINETQARLLVLDPLMDGVPLTPWNALLEHWGSKKLRNTNARWSEKATLDKVVQVGLRSRRGTTIALA